MKRTQEVTCRYGVTYMATFDGTKGAVARSFDLMTRCCCWMCTNLECAEPRNEKLENCGNVCELLTKHPYCHDDLDI